MYPVFQLKTIRPYLFVDEAPLLYDINELWTTALHLPLIIFGPKSNDIYQKLHIIGPACGTPSIFLNVLVSENTIIIRGVFFGISVLYG